MTTVQRQSTEFVYTTYIKTTSEQLWRAITETGEPLAFE